MATPNSIRRLNLDSDDPDTVMEEARLTISISKGLDYFLEYPQGLTIPGTEDSGPYVEISAFKYRRGFKKSLEHEVLYKVFLPFPFQGISFESNARYNEFSALVGRSVSASGDVEGAMGAVKEGALQGVAGSLATGGADIAASIMSKFPGASISADQVKNQASTIAGVIFNPRLEMMFEGTEIRSYSFSYLMFPRNATESFMCRKIIERLELSHYPTFLDPDTKIFLDYPDEFVMRICNPDSSNMLGVQLIPDCFLRSFSYSINPISAGRVFADGSPTSYQLNMSFVESNYLTREDVKSLRQGDLPTD